jgi:hypothetical protein
VRGVARQPGGVVVGPQKGSQAAWWQGGGASSGVGVGVAGWWGGFAVPRARIREHSAALVGGHAYRARVREHTCFGRRPRQNR